MNRLIHRENVESLENPNEKTRQPGKIGFLGCLGTFLGYLGSFLTASVF